MIAARQGATSTLLPDGKVLIAGGVESTGPDSMGSEEIYDPHLRAFRATGSMAVTRV